MIRFSCPACSSVIKAPTRRAGDDVPCPKCTQLLQVPAEENAPKLTALAPSSGQVMVDCTGCSSPMVLPEGRMGQQVECPSCKAAFTPMIGRSAPSLSLPPLGPPADKANGSADRAVTLGLARDSEVESGKLVLAPKRSKKAHAAAVVSLLFGVPALPVAIAQSQFMAGVVLAGLGVLVAVYALFAALRRKGAGLGLCFICLAVCGSNLHSAVMLAGGPGGVLRAFGGWITSAATAIEEGEWKGPSSKP